MPNTKNAIGYPNVDGSFGEIANNNPKYDGINAADVSFDNTGTGMSATNVQGAIGEVNSNLSAYVVDSGTITNYATGVQPIYPNELDSIDNLRIYKLSNHMMLIEGCFRITNDYDGTASQNKLFSVPDRFSAALPSGGNLWTYVLSCGTANAHSIRYALDGAFLWGNPSIIEKEQYYSMYLLYPYI